MHRKTVYLPLEVCRRELVGKVFLATRLAKDGHRVILFQSDFFDNFGWPKNGIYIGKNCFRTERPYDTRFYNKMKSQGVSLWHLDEEGGIYAGQGPADWSRRLKLRLDPLTLDGGDKILCWGKWQKQAFSENKPAAEILVTGSPNFDVFHPKYAAAFSEYDSRQTNGEEGYILVNTRFSLTNGFLPLHYHLMGKGATSKLIDRTHFSLSAVTIGALQYLLTKLIFDLARKFPKRKFVIRPHPAEDPKFYSSVFDALDNVSVQWRGDVGSWIRRSDALIHNGCTTALQAIIAGKPVITYVPLPEPTMVEFKLPNTVGEICHSEDEVIEALGNSYRHQSLKNTFSDTISGTDAIELIARLVNSEPSTRAEGDKFEELLKGISKKHTLSRMKHHIRKSLSLLHPEIGRRMESEANSFDFKFFSEAPILHGIADKHYDANSSCVQLKDTCCIIHPAAEKSS
jgi:surface carbohydrate biosynthesis protein